MLTPCTKPRSRGGTTKSLSSGAGAAALARSSAERAPQAPSSHPASPPPAPPSSPSKTSSPGNGSLIIRPRASSPSSSSPPPHIRSSQLLSPDEDTGSPPPSPPFPATAARSASAFLLFALPRRFRLTCNNSCRLDSKLCLFSFNNVSTTARKSGLRRSYCSTTHFGTQHCSTGSTSISSIANDQSQFLGRRLFGRRTTHLPSRFP